MDIRQYLSGLALLAALATASGCNGLERRALADTSGVQGAQAAAAPSNLAAGETDTASGSGDSEKPHPNGFFYDSQGRKVPPTPESIKAYEATLKAPDDELYRLIDSLDAKRAEEENKKGNYEFALGLRDQLSKARNYSFTSLTTAQREKLQLAFNEYCAAVLYQKEKKQYEIAVEFIDEAIRAYEKEPAAWVNAIVLQVAIGDKSAAKIYAEGYFDRADENHKSYSRVRRWYNKNK